MPHDLPLRCIGAVGLLLQLGALKDADPAPACRDQAVRLQHLHGKGLPRALHAQHQRQEVVGQRQLVAVDTAIRMQKPAAEPLLDGGPVVGQRPLRDWVWKA